jgi:MFS family permease
MEAHDQARFDRGPIRTRIPARMDRLPWSSWHWLIVLGLGTVWILDGLEVTIVGAIGARLTEKDALGITTGQLGLAGTIYVLGAASGALFWGYLTDRFGRKKLFMITLGVYLLATVATAFASSFLFFAICRFFTGFGIGGEYAAINSAIDELIPARVRGWVDLSINGSYWLGAAFGAAVTPLLLNPDLLSADTGWRISFGMGAVLALGILLVRRNVPESPRWLALHGRNDEAERVVAGIEEHVKDVTGRNELPEARDELELEPRKSTGFGEIARTMFGRYPRRSILGFTLMSTQAFIYNATVFTLTAGLVTFYKASSQTAPLYLVPFAIANFLGALLLGRFFDTIGRRAMIAGTYFISAVGLVTAGVLFKNDSVSIGVFVAILCATFFFASAAASAGYLTISETFPIEIRAMAIAFFFAISTGIGGAVGPLVFAKMIESGDRGQLFIGYLIAAGLMAIAALVELVLGVDAEQETLENVAEPLSAEEAARV